MSVYIPPEIAHEIQDYLDQTTMIISLLISKSFNQPKTDTRRIYKYRGHSDTWTSTGFQRIHHIVPKWVMKIRLNEDTVDEDFANCSHIIWLHLGMNLYVTEKCFSSLVNLEHLSVGKSQLYKKFEDLSKLESLHLGSKKGNRIDLSNKLRLKRLHLGKLKQFNGVADMIHLEWIHFGEQHFYLPSVLRNMVNLKFLDCSQCKEINLYNLELLPLEEVYISNSYGAKSKIARIPTLKILHLPDDCFSLPKFLVKSDHLIKIHPPSLSEIYYKMLEINCVI